MFSQTHIDLVPDRIETRRDLDRDYGLQMAIPCYRLGEVDADHAEHARQQLRRRGAEAVFDKIYSASYPMVVETHIEEWDDPARLVRIYQLHYRLTAVQTRHVTMPVFEYVNHLGRIEWKCPACAMINPIEHRYCGENFEHPAGCGRPRDEAR